MGAIESTLRGFVAPSPNVKSNTKRRCCKDDEDQLAVSSVITAVPVSNVAAIPIEARSNLLHPRGQGFQANGKSRAGLSSALRSNNHFVCIFFARVTFITPLVSALSPP